MKYLNAGDLSANMVGRVTIETKYEDATITGLLTGLELSTEKLHFDTTNKGRLRTSYVMHICVTVGGITLDPVRPDHPVLVEEPTS